MSIRPFRDIKRRKTKKIKVGKVEIGGDAPISVQSMTNTLTTDVDATIKQINELNGGRGRYCKSVLSRSRFFISIKKNFETCWCSYSGRYSFSL